MLGLEGTFILMAVEVATVALVALWLLFKG